MSDEKTTMAEELAKDGEVAEAGKADEAVEEQVARAKPAEKKPAEEQAAKAKPAKAKSSKAKGGFPFTIVRHVVQVATLLLFLAPLLFAGWGLFGFFSAGDDVVPTPSSFPFYGTLSSSSVFGITLLDPFAMLQAIVASKSFALDMLIGALPVLVVYGLIRGRVFCGWFCPVNLVLEIVDWLRKKMGIRVSERVLPRHTKVYVAVGVLVLSLLLSFPVFEALSPISFINKGLVLGSLVGGITLIAIIVIELFWGHRVWCRSICPLGGFYEVVGKVGLVNVHIDHDACIKCNTCKKSCMCDPEILDAPIAGDDTIVRAGDCMLCGKCVEACPKQALSVKLGRK